MASRFTSSGAWSWNTPTTKGVRLEADRSAAAPATRRSATEPLLLLASAVGRFGPSRSPKDLTVATTAAACAAVTFRFDLGAKMTPMREAPARQAASAASGSVMPHTLTRARSTTPPPPESPTPKRSSMAWRGSAARMSASPTSTPCTPNDRYLSTSDELAMPERARIIGCFCSGVARVAARLAWRSVVSRSSLKVCRLRLFTPITLASHASAMSSSWSVCTSTRGSMPTARQAAMSSRSWDTSKMATMSSTVSAPNARASRTW
mmetsp:Transcript_31554/g.53256  ORF Transcript_31554/g.53256 Transcript_31554/m.53256 type:complete len:264 (+) Transcript_31554:602-1393(+)